MRTFLRFCLMIGWLVAALLPASGASVIFYSKADNSYGWCAGYSYGKGESCAREQCLQYGSKCELAIECDGRWSATAFAPDPYEGFGASCEWPNAAGARSIALLSCIYSSHALCSTSDAFDGSGNAAAQTKNEAYDLGWYTQSLLLMLGYDIGEVDGDIGSMTRTALKQFQTAAGLEPTGEPDWNVMALLLYAAGGTGNFVRHVIAETDGADQKTVATYTFRYAGTPASDMTLSAELAGFNEDWQRYALAALINYAQAPCSTISAAQQSAQPESWTVSCAEGNYTLALGGTTPVVSRADCAIDGPPTPGPSADTGPNFKPSPVTVNGPAPGSMPAVDCADVKPIPVGCPAEDDRPLPTPEPGPNTDAEFKPSLLTPNAPAPGSQPPSNADREFKPSPASIGGASPDFGAAAAVDCLDPQQDFKPSANTVNGISPDLAAAMGASGN